MPLVPVTCVVPECDRCGQALDDFASIGGIPHFRSKFEAQAWLGGIADDGRILPGAKASGGVLLPSGACYCAACKMLPHLHVPGLLIENLCARCDQLPGSHPLRIADADAGPPARAGRVQRGEYGLSNRNATCDTTCVGQHQFADFGLPEPPNGSRIEFGFGTDRWAAWRNDEQTALAGAPPAMRWSLYPEPDGHTWSCLQRTFGSCLAEAILLTPSGLVRPAGE
jgi:hypothetical protein